MEKNGLDIGYKQTKLTKTTMTPKQQLRSLEKKMERIQKNNPEIDFNETSRNYNYIKEYYEIRQKHFYLQFQIEHCQTCGKKL